MKRIHLAFFDAGGGHRSAANALRKVIEQQGRPWELVDLNLQELLDPLDIFRKLTGVRAQDLYNITLKRGWTLGAPQLTKAMHSLIRLYHPQQVRVLRDYWRKNPTDLVVSLIPNFNRALYQSLQRGSPKAPMMTIMTDLADYPPHFWIERKQKQYLVTGTEMAARQAKRMGYPDERVFRASGMILHPRFYDEIRSDRAAERGRLGLDPKLTTGLVLFGGHGSRDMLAIARRISQSELPVQLILICGHNEKLAEKLRAREFRMPVFVEGFTSEVPYYMYLSDFFIGKPGPGSISEALRMQLPVIVERNAFTLPQERYNTNWIKEQRVGLVLEQFREIVPAIEELLRSENYATLRRNTMAHDNRAVFEIPEMMERVLAQADTAQEVRA